MEMIFTIDISGPNGSRPNGSGPNGNESKKTI